MAHAEAKAKASSDAVTAASANQAELARFVAEQKVSEDELAAAQDAVADAQTPSGVDALAATQQALADAEAKAKAAAAANQQNWQSRQRRSKQQQCQNTDVAPMECLLQQ